MYRLVKCLMVLSIILFYNPAFAQTPDGETPAQESVCDVLDPAGAASGLCNAYCEAMDCDGDARASAKACDMVRSRFMDVSGGALLPCEVVCPCDFSAQTVTDMAFVFPFDCSVQDNDPILFDRIILKDAAAADALIVQTGPALGCLRLDDNVAVENITNLSPEILAVCGDDVVAVALEVLAVTCPVPPDFMDP